MEDHSEALKLIEDFVDNFLKKSKSFRHIKDRGRGSFSPQYSDNEEEDDETRG